jgi:hypothetical protein
VNNCPAKPDGVVVAEDIATEVCDDALHKCGTAISSDVIVKEAISDVGSGTCRIELFSHLTAQT